MAFTSSTAGKRGFAFLRKFIISRGLSSAQGSIVLSEAKQDTGVCILQMNRPKAFNALNKELVFALRNEFKRIESDDSVRCVVLTSSSQKAFAAGADIKEMLAMDYTEMRDHDRADSLLGLKDLVCTKPIVGAVNGLCLGGGAELAYLCDILIAGENAKFGQPEINLGIMPGAGGTQRLTHAVGKSLSMQMNLTGEPIDAHRALLAGLVSEVVPEEKCVERATEVATQIASKSSVTTKKIKDAVLSVYEIGSLKEGVKYEHERFISCWATEDQREGMQAFAEKRKPVWKHN